MMECYLTRRGRRMIAKIGAGTCWIAMLVLLSIATLVGSADVRGWGLALAIVAGVWTVSLVVGSHSEVVRAAYEMGREQERGKVRPMR